MSMSRLRTAMMVATSSAWLNPAQLRPLLEGFALGRARLPLIESAHKGLLAVADAEPEPDAELATLRGESQAADVTFGAMSRGVYQTLSGLAELARSPALAARYEAARDQIFPQGVGVVRWKYAEKAGEAEMVVARRTPEVDAVLASVTLLDHTTLSDAVDALVAAGRTLGANDLRKRELEQKREAAPEGASAARDSQQARQVWMRVARALVDDVAMAGVEPDVAERILGGLQEALARVALASRNDEANDGTPEPAAKAPTKDASGGASPVVVTPDTPANDTAPAVRKVG